MNHSLLVCLSAILLFGCSEEAYESDSTESGNNSQNVTPNFLTINTDGYWIYDVQNSSQDIPNMTLISQDSVYVTSISGNNFSLSANNNGIVNGSMNGILTNGTMNTTSTTLSINGEIDLVNFFSDLELDNTLELSALLLYDLEANSSDVMYLLEDSLTDTLSIQGSEIPIELSYELATTKVNFYDIITLNGTEYNNVFEGILTFSLNLNGIFDLGFFTQTVAILETQNILETKYFFAEQVGLVRAETTQGYSLSTQFVTFLELAGIPLDFPTSVTVENVEDLSDYFIGL